MHFSIQGWTEEESIMSAEGFIYMGEYEDSEERDYVKIEFVHLLMPES